MKKLFKTLLLSLTFLCIACGGDDEPTKPANKQPHRTVLIYIVSDNDLNSYSYDDINEMLEGIKSVDTQTNNLLVYVDNTSTPVLFRITKDKKGNPIKEIIREYEEQVSTSPEVMKEICSKVFTDYPAQSYGFIYWSHGEGWKPIPLASSSRWIGADWGDGRDFTNIDELKEVLAIIPHLDFLLFDACFMMTVEVAYALRDEADYIIASPTEIPGPGAPYDAIVPAMFKKENSAINIAKAYYDTYNSFYINPEDENGMSVNQKFPNDNKGIWIAGVSITVLRTSALSNLATATQLALSKAANINLSAIKSSLFDYDQRTKSSSSRIGYYDMVQLMQALCTESDFATWKTAFDSAMAYYQTTSWNWSGFAGMFSMEGTCGLSHYLPTGNNALNAAYAQTDWYSAAKLGDWGW